ncbi:TIP49-domain-containing protein [Armillaria solidipes]|uniref:RuvB-like helicase n=1 Tax=Armillaria solidipes TaxID=1076256 RepID=A0A2H3CM59_9AGAR|nr:TIP49-domain-containing protein [Armillaria solidipes]
MEVIVRRVIWEISHQDLRASNCISTGWDSTTGNGWTDQGQEGRWYDSQDDAGRSNSRKTDVACWASIDGKDRFALGMAQMLGPDIPFTVIAASEASSLSMSKTEALTQAFRQSIGVRIKEKTELVEGEVVEIQTDQSLTGATKTGKLTIKTTDIETIYDLGAKMIDALSKEKDLAGDVITMDKTFGKITKLSRSFALSRDYDAMETEGVSLHEIDVINSGDAGFPGFVHGRHKLYQARATEWREKGKVDIIPGVRALLANKRSIQVPFIDEVHMLVIECFLFLNRALENDLARLVVMASNRGMAHIRGTAFRSPYGLPVDLLDRVLIVSTKPYGEEDIEQTIQLRCQEEDATLTADATSVLTSTAMQTTLRYSLNLISCAQMLVRKRKAEQVGVEDLRRAYTYFMDEKRSVQWLKEQQGSRVFGEIPTTSEYLVDTS